MKATSIVRNDLNSDSFTDMGPYYQNRIHLQRVFNSENHVAGKNDVLKITDPHSVNLMERDVKVEHRRRSWSPIHGHAGHGQDLGVIPRIKKDDVISILKKCTSLQRGQGRTHSRRSQISPDPWTKLS